MTPREEDWLALNLVARVGGKTIDTLIERFGDVASVLQAPPESISHSCGHGFPVHCDGYRPSHQVVLHRRALMVHKHEQHP